MSHSITQSAREVDWEDETKGREKEGLKEWGRGSILSPDLSSSLFIPEKENDPEKNDGNVPRETKT